MVSEAWVDLINLTYMPHMYPHFVFYYSSLCWTMCPSSGRLQLIQKKVEPIKARWDGGLLTKLDTMADDDEGWNSRTTPLACIQAYVLRSTNRR